MIEVFCSYDLKFGVYNGYINSIILDKYPFLKNRFFFDEQEKIGRDLYLNKIDKIHAKDGKIYTKELFLEEFQEKIDKNLFKRIRLIRSDILIHNKEEYFNTSLIESNGHSFNPKKFLAQYVFEYYIYRGGIFQIIRAVRGFNSISLFIKKPSGKFTEKTIPLEFFARRPLFFTYKEAEDYLINVWIKENNIPKLRAHLKEFL